MSELPNGWARTTLGEVHDLNPRHPKETARTQSVSFVPMPAVSDETGRIESQETRELETVWKGYTHFREHDVLFAKITPCMENGKIALAEGLLNGIGCGTTEFHVLRGRGATDPKLVWYFLRDKSFRIDAERSMTGAVGQRRVPKSYLEKHPFPLPPLAEQKRIVEKLDSLTTASTEARTALTRVESLVEHYKEAVLTQTLFTIIGKRRGNENAVWCASLEECRDDFKSSLRGSRLQSDAGLSFGDLPEGAPHWGRVYLGQVIEFTSGYAFKSSWYTANGRRLLRGANVAPGKIDWEDCKHLPEDQSSDYQHLQVRHGDIVLAMDRPLISSGLKVAKVDRESDGALLVQRVARIRASENVLQSYVWHILNSRIFLKHAIGRATGMDLPHISSNDIQTTPILLPTIEEQSEIVDRIDEAFTQIETLATAAKSARERLDKLDRAVLAKAFRGQLVPQDPNDEPASELLKRLQKESA